MNTLQSNKADYETNFRLEILERSDKLMNYFLSGFFLIGLLLATFYGTWLIAFGVGGCSLAAYYLVKLVLPQSNLHQYVLSVVLGIFMAQFIYQMHGLFEMHFFAFIASVLLITYQNWRLQLPLAIFVIIHHATLGYMQNIGVDGVYFTQLDSMELQTFIIHIILAGVIFFISGLWGYHLNKHSKINLVQSLAISTMEKEALINKERIINQDALQVAYSTAENARLEAENANKAKSVFLATMSHEIRTPMNGVIGTTSLLSETLLTEEQQEYTKTISTCGEALLKVINDVLDFSKIESGNMELEELDFDLRKCIEDVLDVFADMAGKKGVDLVYEIDHSVPLQIIGDNLRLRQVLINLISNAIKFTEFGEIFVGVHLLKTNANGQIELQFKVRDTGIGIPEDKIEKLFKAFSQVDSSTTRKYGGTGLGLIICDKLIELMGGSITVESKYNEGTTFIFTIQSVISLKSLRTYVTNELSGIEGKQVLIVDDNSTNRSILKNQLEKWKLVPILASSGKEAIEILQSNKHFDLILSDMQMPEMDGCELAEQIKLIQPTIPIILLSSVGDEYYKKYNHLFKAILTKPIKQEMLSKLIINELRGKISDPQPSSSLKNMLSIDFAESYPLHILVAEDNVINQNLILTVLSKLGYKADLAENGKRAVDKLGEGNYNLVFMDMQMPEMDGIEATQIIRNQAGYQPKIIAMTANAMKEDKEECLKAGMDDFLSKPVMLNDLKNMLVLWATSIKAGK